MGPEANIDAIHALEKRIKEGDGDITKLKRDRNSLLNISTRVPPEILGYIFNWCLVRKPDWLFEGLRKGSYRFVLVCHHWFETASQTPELWGLWGNKLRDWKKRHHRSGATPVDLVLDHYELSPAVFDKSLQDAVRSRVIQNTIRQVLFFSEDFSTLKPIISSLTPDDEGGQNENIESIALHGWGDPALDVSKFFARSHLSRLRSLDLYGNFLVSSWDSLASRTTLLTRLSLNINTSSWPSPPTAAQLFSILTSNPNLQELSLTNNLPNDPDASTSKVQLRHLKTLALTGESRHLLGLLRRLILPNTLDVLRLDVLNLTAEEISGTLAPYMQDYFQRDPRFQGRLGISSSSCVGSISISVGVVSTQTTVPVLVSPLVSLAASTNLPPPNGLEQPFVDLIALVPREHVVFFDVGADVNPPEELFFMMPKIETLHLSRVLLSERFLQPRSDGPHVGTKLLPSLRSLRLEGVVFRNDNRDRLKTYLAHQSSDSRAISLEVVGDLPNWWPEAMNEIRGLVNKFVHRRRLGAEEE